MKTSVRLAAAGIASSLACAVAWMPAHADVVTHWHAVTVQCVLGGPTLPNRAGPPGLLDIAIVQAAVHDAVQAIQGRFEPYLYENSSMLGRGSADAAAAAAAYRMLVGLYGADDPCLALEVDPSVIYSGNPALQAGFEAAAALLTLYRPVFTLPTDPFIGGSEAGEWRPTPGVTQGANTYIAVTAPFAMNRPSQFRPHAPDPLTSTAYVRDFNEVKSLGSATSTTRTAEQTDLARFWSANIPALQHAMARTLADSYLNDLGDKARLLALVSLAAGDAQISVYDAKYHYNLWRPITAIREGDNDGNPNTQGDSAWEPFLLTPPYPDYTSGANCLTGSVTTMLRLFLGTDDVDFSISSTAPAVAVNPRAYRSISQVADEMVEVRILQGIHFRLADEVGRLEGSRIAHWTYMTLLRPIAGVE
jgi:hypothetical protein